MSKLTKKKVRGRGEWKPSIEIKGTKEMQFATGWRTLLLRRCHVQTHASAGCFKRIYVRRISLSCSKPRNGIQGRRWIFYRCLHPVVLTRRDARACAIRSEILHEGMRKPKGVLYDAYRRSQSGIVVGTRREWKCEWREKRNKKKTRAFARTNSVTTELNLFLQWRRSEWKCPTTTRISTA